MAFSDSVPWEFDHPNTLYTWEGACVWIPCTYRMPKSGKYLNSLILYHSYKYDEVSKEYRGTILYNKTNTEEAPKDRRVEFLGDNRSNCTFRIDPVKVKDSGQLGLRMISGSDKWMEEIGLNVSGKALGDGVLHLGHGQGGGGKHPVPGTGWRAGLPAEARQRVPASDMQHRTTGLWQTGAWALDPPEASRPPLSSCPLWNPGCGLPDFSREDGNLDFQVKSPNMLMLVINSNEPFTAK